MKDDHLQRDPHAEREADRYENPIPSREYILELLRESVGPMTHEELCDALDLGDEDSVEALRRRLIAMVRDGQLVSNRRGGFGTLDKMNLQKGRVIGHPDGFGFVATGEGRGNDIFLSSRQMRRVFDGDVVLVRIAGRDHKGRAEGSIVEVVEQRTTKLVGRYFQESGVYFVRPDNPRISQDIVIPKEESGGAENGQMVLVAITVQPSRKHMPAGRVIQVLGEHRAPGMEITLALHNYNIPHEWPERIAPELDDIPDQVEEGDKGKRVDLRHLDFVTIDGEDAKDFDDAVYAESLKRGGWRLYVAIADVSHYVRPGTELDDEAWNRGTSVYFPGEVVPMLPEKLSNGLCSLNPEVDRLCMVCEMTIDTSGNVTRFQFYEGVMHSRARLTYTQVAGMIAQKDDPESSVRQRFRAVVERVDHLHDLYRALRAAREKRGAIDFDTVETRILFDEQRKIEQILPTVRTDAHRLIEECMLCANVCAARLLEKSKLPALYRVHEPPAEERLENLREFLAEIGLGLPGGDSPSPVDFQSVLEQVEDRPDAHVIQQVMLRSMTRADYRPENIGHFGLNYDAYTHFTSPIRRYPDLLVHRAIRALLRSKKRVPHLKRVFRGPKQTLADAYPYDDVWMEEAGVHTSFTERRADEATRDVENWLKCEYLLDKVGEEYTGVVTSVVGFGLFIELNDLFVEGLVHITGLPRDYYYYEPVHHRLVGERTRRVFRLGDVLRVRVSRVDLEERKIDFDLVEDEGSGKGSGKGGARGKTGKGRQERTGSGESQPKKKGRSRRRQGEGGDRKTGDGGSQSAKSGKSGSRRGGSGSRSRRSKS